MDETFQRLLELRAAGRWQEAAGLALRVHAELPDAIPPALLAAEALLRLDRYRAMRDVVLRCANPPVQPPQLLLQLVRWARRLEECELVERLLMESDWRAGASSAELAELALHAGSSGLYGIANAITTHALANDPTHPNLHYLLGMHRMFSGDTEGSVESLERALALCPGMPNAYLLLSMQDAQKGASRHVPRIRRALAGPCSAEDEAYLCYALHQYLDAAGEYDAAWRVLERGHAARRRLSSYDRARERALFDRLMRFEPTGRDAITGEGATRLVFIVGMFRSGTSLIERVLSAHPQVADAGETFQFSACMRQATDHDTLDVVDLTIAERASAADFAEVRRRMQAYADWRAGGRAVLTEKLPSNFLNVGFILAALPEARIVHMRRNPLDTCLSNLRTFFGGGVPYACDQLDMADYYGRYRRLMAHWDERWPGRILHVDYESFVADPDTQTGRLLDWCGLEIPSHRLDLERPGGISATASAAHVRRGVLPDRGRIRRRYEAHLGPLSAALGNLPA